MNIVTEFGEFKDIKIESYGSDETYSLAKIEDADKNEYMILGFDAPITDDNVWRFWVECGDADGYAETHKAKLKHDDMTFIRQMYLEYKSK